MTNLFIKNLKLIKNNLDLKKTLNKMNLPEEILVHVFTFINLNVKYFREEIKSIPDLEKNRLIYSLPIIFGIKPPPIFDPKMISEKSRKFMKKNNYIEGKKIRTDKYVIEIVCRKWRNIINNNTYLKSLYKTNYNIPHKYETINYYQNFEKRDIIKSENYRNIYYNNYYFRKRTMNRENTIIEKLKNNPQLVNEFFKILASIIDKKENT